jgi:hypothetical protein
MMFLFVPLILTVLIEIVVIFALDKDSFLNKKRYFLVVLAANLITNPTLNLLHLMFSSSYTLFSTYLPISELVVVIIEALLYFKFLNIRGTKALLLSFVANSISFLFGFLLVL